MRIPPKRNRIPRISHWTRRDQDRPSQETSQLGLDNLQKDKGNAVLPRLMQLQQTIHRRFQQNIQTTIGENKKGIDRQLRIGRQRTPSIRRIEDKTQHSTSAGLVQLRRTNQYLTRCHKICLLWDTVTTMPRWEMETSGIPIQDNVDAEYDYDLHDKGLLTRVHRFHE